SSFSLPSRSSAQARSSPLLLLRSLLTSIPLPIRSVVASLQSARVRLDMLLPKGGVTWKSTKARLPPLRLLVALVSRPRFIISLALTGMVLLLWKGIRSSAADMQRYGCPLLGLID
ncbi:hypothetical protein AJ78_08946, partial [Emergomyces pasteurianus Ep9510]